MSRGLSSTTKAAFDAPVIFPALFFEMVLKSGPVRFWSGLGIFEFLGEDFVGAGTMGKISPITETANVMAQGMQFTLSGFDKSLMALLLQERIQGSPIRFWVAVMTGNDPSATVADYFLAWEGFADTAPMSDDGQSGEITINGENRLVGLFRPRVSRYNTEDQRKLFPGDTGFDYVPSLIGKEVAWMQNSVTSGRWINQGNPRLKNNIYYQP